MARDGIILQSRCNNILGMDRWIFTNKTKL
jgi:hypothetical protein